MADKVDARATPRLRGLAESVSVNAIVVCPLDELFARLKKSNALHQELLLEFRAQREFLPG